MNPVNYAISFDTHLPTKENHIHRIVRFYKRAVLHEGDKTWSHHFFINDRKVKFTLIPGPGFFERAPLIETSDARYTMLCEAAIRVNGISKSRLQEILTDLRVANKNEDFIQIVDLLDDLEDLIFETDDEKKAFYGYERNRFINSFSFIKVKVMPQDEAIQEAVKRVNECARFYFMTNIAIRKAQLKKAIKEAVQAINNPRSQKEEILDKVEKASTILSESINAKNLARAVRMLKHFDRTIYLTEGQEGALLSDITSQEVDESFVLALYKKAEEGSGTSILADRKDFKVRFHKKHFDEILTKLEKLIDFAKIKLTDEMIDRLEQASALLLEDCPDADTLDFLLKRIENEVVAKCGDQIHKHFGSYLESANRDERKIFSINNLIAKNNFLSAFCRIVDLNKK